MNRNWFLLASVAVLAFCFSSTSGNKCLSDPCGDYAFCSLSHNETTEEIICRCPSGYLGNPYEACVWAECHSQSHCEDHMKCIGGRCVDPCLNHKHCGSGATCIVEDHVAICNTCPLEQTTTEPSVNPEKVKRLTRSYRLVRSPADIDKTAKQMCGTLRCTINADCNLNSDPPVCSCPPGHTGDPLYRCNPIQCHDDKDCSGEHRCFQQLCVDLCYGYCGKNAICQLINNVPTCSCPKGYVGNAFYNCWEPISDKECKPNTCGNNAICTRQYGAAGVIEIRCYCPVGYIGNPLKECVKGECEENSECPDHLSCLDYKCSDPCIDKGRCGTGTVCTVKNHQVVCSCISEENHTSEVPAEVK